MAADASETDCVEPGTPAEPATEVATGGRSTSYVARHWRGELSLARSYWVNVVILSWPFEIVGQLVERASATMGASRIVPAAVLAMIAAGVVLLPWQVVGVWRAARAHVRRTGRRFWARAAQVVMTLGLLGTVGIIIKAAPTIPMLAQLAFGTDDLPAGEAEVVGAEIRVRDPLGFGMSDRIEQLLREHPAVTTLRLDSDGGRIGEGVQLAQIVADRHLVTYTERGCHSACTVAFLAGAERVLHEDAHLGFHRAEAITGWDDDDDELSKAYRDAGVPPEFVRRVQKTAFEDMWYPSHDELLAAGIVTRISRGTEFALFPTTLADDDPFVKALVEIPPFAAMRRHDPDLFAELASVMRSSSAPEQMSLPRTLAAPILLRALHRHLPTASTAAIVELAAAASATLDDAVARDPSACGGFMLLDWGEAEPAPRGLEERQLVAIAAVIESSASTSKPPLPTRAAEGALERAWARFGERHPAHLQTLQELETNEDASQAAVCTAMAALFREVLSLSDENTALAMTLLLPSLDE